MRPSPDSLPLLKLLVRSCGVALFAGAAVDRSTDYHLRATGADTGTAEGLLAVEAIHYLYSIKMSEALFEVPRAISEGYSPNRLLQRQSGSRTG